ncbi:MAG: insulinase family protein [Verrucomicrobiota bacterium]|nr:insulinase family protein [Verrucomicrobiota bacterium]
MQILPFSRPPVALLVGFLSAATAQLLASDASFPLPPGMQRVTSVEGITEYSLANGLRVLLFPDPSRPIITVNLTYKVGSRHEGYGETGMAHLLEHLVFKGTPRHPNIPQELTERGARANGTTWFDRTNYYETIDATEENLRWALDLEADRMINSHIARQDLEKEFTVVRNEYERGENSPASVLYKRMLAAVFQWHNYGHSTIGEKSDIEGAPIERLQAFYRTYYQPDNAVLVIAGRIDERKTLALVDEYFGKIPKPARRLPVTYTKEPTQDGERQIMLRRRGDVQVFSCMHRTVAGSHPDHAALSVLANLLSDEPSGRLYKALVETRKAVRVSGSASGFAEAGFVDFVAEVRQEQSIDEAKAAILAVLEDTKSNSPTQEEIDKAKTRLLKSFELLLKRSDRVGLALSNSIGMGDWRLAFLHRDNLEKVTPEEVARVARHYFKPANRTLGFFIPDQNPDRAEIPDAPDLVALLEDYKGKPAVSQGEDFDPSPANIEKRTTRGALPNGLRYALLPKETRGDAVSATLTFRFGTLETLRGRSIVGRFTANLLDRGTQNKTRQQLADALDRLKARVSVGGGASAATVSIESDRARLLEVLRLAREILREPSFPANEFEKYKQEYLAGIEQQKSDPSGLASNLYARISDPPYEKEDPRYTRTFEEEAAAVSAVTLEQVKEFYRSFYGASHATAAVVGDFDPQEVAEVLGSSFGDWQNPSKYERIAKDYQPVPARTEMINTPDKANAVYLAGFGFAMRDDHPHYPAINIGGYMMGGGFLNSRLATRIRQKEGLSYGVRGSFYASALDQDAGFSASMIYNPQSLAKLETAFREEVERAAKEGFSSEELEAAKSGWLQSRKVSRSSDAALAGTLNGYLFIGRDLYWDAKHEAAVRNLTVPDVNAAMKTYLDHSRMISVKAGDLHKAGKL